MSQAPSLKKNIALSTMYQILLVVLPFITAPYVSRVIGPEGSGINSYTNSIQTYFSMFAALGTASYGAREISRERDNVERRSVLFWEIELMTVITSLVCIVVWFVMIQFSGRYKVYFLALTMGLFSTMFDISWFFTGIEQFKYTVAKNALFKLAGVVLMFLFVKKESDLLLYIIIMAASQMLGNLSMWMYMPRFLTKVDRRQFKLGHHFRETLIYFVPSIATSIYTVLDRSLIQWITKNDAENGYYQYATQIINIMKALTFASLNTVLGSRIAYLFAEEKYDEIKSRINDSINYILFMGIGICFGLIGIAPRFVPAYLGERYDRVVPMLILMSPIIVVIGVSNCLGSQYYTPSGKRSLSAKFIIAGAITNLCLNLVLIPKFWGYGAIVASLLAELVITVLYLKFCDGYFDPRTLWREGWKKFIAGASMLCMIKLVDRFLAGNDLIAVIVEFCVGSATYLLLIWLLKDSFVTDLLFGKILKRKGKR